MFFIGKITRYLIFTMNVLINKFSWGKAALRKKKKKENLGFILDDYRVRKVLRESEALIRGARVDDQAENDVDDQQGNGALGQAIDQVLVRFCQFQRVLVHGPQVECHFSERLPVIIGFQHEEIHPADEESDHVHEDGMRAKADGKA